MKAPARISQLDRLAAKLRTALRRETMNIIEIGNLLIESRTHLKHGEWQPWLAEHFDLTYRTALRYVATAEYVARKSKSDTVSDFANLSAGVLYPLAEGRYTAEQEAAILTKAKSGDRVDLDTAQAICDALDPPDYDDVDEDAGDRASGSDDAGDDDGSKGGRADEDAEINAILDGPPPAVSPPVPITPPNFALRDFDQAIGVLKRLMTKSSAQFAGSVHSREDLEKVESFIRAVADRARSGCFGKV